MIRSFAFAAVAMIAAAPAFAADKSTDKSGDAALNTAHASELGNLAAAKQAEQILASKGYVNIAINGRDQHGLWTGLAVKDGKTVLVAVALPHPQAQVTN